MNEVGELIDRGDEGIEKKLWGKGLIDKENEKVNMDEERGKIKKRIGGKNIGERSKK